MPVPLDEVFAIGGRECAHPNDISRKTALGCGNNRRTYPMEVQVIDDPFVTAFMRAAEDWICDGYSLDIRYCAERTALGTEVWDASIGLSPVPHSADHGMTFDGAGYVLGQHQAAVRPKSELLELVQAAMQGRIAVPGGTEMLLSNGTQLNYFSEMVLQDRWFSPMHLQVFGPPRGTPSASALAHASNALRVAQPPFDGLADLTHWLGLKLPGASPTITLRVLPPVDLIIDRSTLDASVLRLTLHAHPNFDVEGMSLAVRGVPDKALTTRRQIASEIKWEDSSEGGIRTGTATIQMPNCYNVLTILTLGDALVRRHWFIDPAKAVNLRMLAMQHFDQDIRKVKQALFESSDSGRVESAVAAILYLLGFNPAVQIETDAPDLVVTTPGGKLALVECTTRIADFHTKVGKLVDRRTSLAKSLASTGNPSEVHAILVCRMPRDQVAAQASEVQAHNIILATREDLDQALHLLRYVNDPDALLAAAAAKPGEPFLVSP